MMDDAMQHQFQALNLNQGSQNDCANFLPDYEFSGEDEVEYEIQNSQPLTLEQQKEELKRKLQAISSKGKSQKAGNR
jgi:hypothetical protein